MRPWLLAETNYGEIKTNPPDTVVLPLGATEPHNLHLPYGTDTIQVETLGERACRLAHERGAKVVLLPAIPYGTETNLREFPLAINLDPSTLLRVLENIVASLEQSGVRKLVLLNGHGGNDFKPMLRELYGRTRVHLFLCDWFRGLGGDIQRELFREPGDHAGAAETAFIMAARPDLVARDPATGAIRADAGTARATKLEAVNKGWLSITRPWHLLTTNTGCGNPFEATPELGEKLLATLAERLASALVELSRAEVDERFPY